MPNLRLPDIERALQDSEQRFRAIFDLAAVGISQVDLHGNWLLVNQKLCAIVGYTSEEMQGFTFQDITYPDDLDTDLGYVNQLLAGTRSNYTMEKRYVRKDGEVVWVKLAVSLVRDRAGQPAYFVSVVEDINLRKQIESELRASEERYRTLVDSVPQMMWLNQPDGSVAFFNQHVYEYTGRSEAEMAQGGWLQSIHPDDQPAFTSQHQAAVRVGATYKFEARFQQRNGTYCWHMAEVVPLRDPSGAVTGWLGTATEIDARKRAEEALSFLAKASVILSASLEYEGPLQTVASMAVPGIADVCVIDVLEDDGQLVRVAAAHCDPAQEPAIRLFRPVDTLVHVLETGQATMLPSSAGNTDRELAGGSNACTALPVPDAHASICVPMLVRGRAIGVICLLVVDQQRQYDGTDLALAQDLASRVGQAVDNARLYRTAQAAVREREALLSIAAHELKNPLTALAGQTALLQRRVARQASFSERDSHTIDQIQEQAERLGDMLDALLDVSRLETGQMRLSRTLLDIGELVRRVTAEVQLALQLSGDQHQLQVQLPAEALSVVGDALRLEQVVRNVVSNALKYSPDGTLVSIELAARSSNVVISVHDQGVGIPAHALPRLFERFYRVESPAGSASGLGIGLYVVKEIIAQHGGTVGVESQPGHGSTFTISLPQQSAATESPIPWPPATLDELPH